MCNENFTLINSFYRQNCGFFQNKDSMALGAFKHQCFSCLYYSFNLQFSLAVRAYYHHLFTLLGSQSFIVRRPTRHPPIWANHAMPPSRANPVLINPLTSCITAQNPITTSAGILTTVTKKPKNTRVCTIALGKRSRYAPSIPEIAPLAPIIGMREW